MSPKMRPILAVVAGVVTAFIVISLVEAAAHAVFAPAHIPDLSTPEAMAAYVASMPIGAFLSVFAGWALGAFAGGVVAALVARTKPFLFAGIIGAVVLAGAVVNMVMIPHPPWFVAGSLVALAAVTWLAGQVVQRRHTKPVAS
jgi:hypothetical protein